MKKSKLYYLVGEDYNDAMEFMNNNGYDTGTFIPDKLTEHEALVLAIDHKTKKVQIFPLEIYAPNSPTRNDEKYQKILNDCRSYEDFVKDVEDTSMKIDDNLANCEVIDDGK